MNHPKFVLWKSNVNSQFYFHLTAPNGKTILSSESYITRQSCLNGIASVKINAPLDSQYERKNSTGNYTFILKAKNGEPIGRSENYTTAYERDQGIEAVKRYAPDAPIDDQA